MPLYMYQASYSAEAIKTLVNNPQDRSGAAKVAIEANGGTMVGAWMAFGQDDIVVIADMPDDESMAGGGFCSNRSWRDYRRPNYQATGNVDRSGRDGKGENGAGNLQSTKLSSEPRGESLSLRGSKR